MKNKKRKKELLEDNKFKEYQQVKRALYKNAINENKTNDEAINIANEDIKKYYIEEDYKCLYQMSENAKKQRKKIEKHIKYWCNRSDLNIYIITYTFNNEYIEKTQEKTRKRKIIKLLNDENISDYIVNIDYGEKNEREHYHAYVTIKEDKESLMIKERNYYKFKPYIDQEIDKKIGYVGIEKVDKSEESNKKLAKYITKLALHSIKVKQTYVSTKKGSEYQQTLKLINEYVKLEKNKGKIQTERRKKEIYEQLSQIGTNKQDKTIETLRNVFGIKLTIK